MEFLIILGIGIFAAILFVNHKIAKAFEQIVFAKGYGTDLNAYYMCFWLGVVGYLYVIALPNAKLDNITLKQQKRLIELIKNTSSQSPKFENVDEESD